MTRYSPQEGLEADDFEEVKKDYAEWAQKNAADAAKESEYPGY